MAFKMVKDNFSNVIFDKNIKDDHNLMDLPNYPEVVLIWVPESHALEGIEKADECAAFE